jgi:hypothetical protein
VTTPDHERPKLLKRQTIIFPNYTVTTKISRLIISSQTNFFTFTLLLLKGRVGADWEPSNKNIPTVKRLSLSHDFSLPSYLLYFPPSLSLPISTLSKGQWEWKKTESPLLMAITKQRVHKNSRLEKIGICCSYQLIVQNKETVVIICSHE